MMLRAFDCDQSGPSRYILGIPAEEIYDFLSFDYIIRLATEKYMYMLVSTRYV